MPTWGGLIKELQDAQRQAPPGVIHFDAVRRKYLTTLAQHTGRNAILYATRWTQGGGNPDQTSITVEDIQGLMEVVNGLAGPSLDLILHSPGGSPEATEALVTYLRSKFTDIRVFVPHAAMSAATMLACSANVIVLGKHSFLGPIDPQFIMQTDVGRSAIPAHAILEQFTLAQEECRDPAKLPSWLPMLRQYGPALIVQCRLAQQLSKTLVGQWLARYMFGGVEADKAKADSIADELANHANFMSHGRFIGRDQARSLGLKIEDLEADQALQDAVLSVFHAISHAFVGTPCSKIIENHLGKAFVKMGAVQQQIILQPPQPVRQVPTQPLPPPVQK